MRPESLLDLYLDEIARVRGTHAGTAETSYYPAVGRVLNEAGRTLRPRVFCLHHPSGESGIPDFGLFEQPQFRRGETPAWNGSAVPERGVMEVKGAAHSIAALLDSKQVREQYLPTYRLLLATNLRRFRLLGVDGAASESFDLGADEAGFWALVHGSRTDALRTRFADFLQRCLLARAPLGKPADVAFFLASYARDVLARLSERADLPALKQLRDGMQSALGITFEGASGEHMFRSTLVQTLFYGLFSGWVAHVRDPRKPLRTPGRFD